ncbi:precorrin-2 dehydrogenase [Bacillus cytotoxicus]
MFQTYPIMCNLTGKNVVIIGGGTIAYRKAASLQNTGAFVTIVSPHICNEMKELSYIEWKKKEFTEDDIQRAHLIYATTNHHEINMMVKRVAHDFQWVNVVSDGTKSSFHTPAIIRRNDYMISISTFGKSPSLAKKIKQKLLAHLPQILK